MMINLTPGVVYKLQFKTDYLSVSGVYRLQKIMTYDEYLVDGGDLVKDFYSLVGKDATTLEKDIASVRANPVLKVADPNDSTGETVKYFPSDYLQGVPDHNVKEYPKLGLIAYIGIVDNPEILDYFIENIKEQILAALGIEADPKLITLDEGAWLTEVEYQEVVAKRDLLAKHTINYYSENKELRAELAKARTTIRTYEEILASK